MVLKPLSGVLLGAACLAPGTAAAQSIDTTAPMLDVEDDIGLAEPLHAGPFEIIPSAELRIEYDSNIYAAEASEVDDWIAIAVPRIEARTETGSTRLSLLAEASFRRYFERTTENSTAAFVGATAGTSLGSSSRLRAEASWRRAVEDRGDPEARKSTAIGPRKLNILTGDIGWDYDGPRMSLGLQGTVTDADYLADEDRARDLRQLSAKASAGYRIAGTMRGMLIGFVNRRDFDLPVDTAGINRDASTYGARVGLKFGDNGIFRGEGSVGVFHFDPSDTSLPDYDGLSVEAALAYLPTRRVAITLDAFRGDAATLRNGAQARTDTTVRLGAQAEARHNLRLQAQLFYRRSKFRGVGVSETTKGVWVEAEFRINRILSFAPSFTYSDRDSDVITENFDRFRVGAELRSRF